MALVFLSGPAIEPVSIVEAKAHLKIDGSAEDALVASLLLTSRLHVEAALGLALIEQRWRLTLDRWPKDGAVRLPIRPVTAIEDVRVFAADGTPVVLDAAAYLLEAGQKVQRLVAAHGAWPEPGRAALGIEIELTAGFGLSPSSVPEPIRHAILMLVAHWYENRDVIEIGAGATRVPSAVSDLLLAWREPRL